MKNTVMLQTIIYRFLSLILNFGLVIYSVNLWGSEGKGIISLVIANVTLVGFFSSIFVGSSMSYFAAKYRLEFLLPYAYSWSVVAGFGVPIFLNYILHGAYLEYLIPLSIITSLVNTNFSLLLGRQKMELYNRFQFAQIVLHIVLIGILYYGFHWTQVGIYFLAQIICFLVLYGLSLLLLLQKFNYKKIRFSRRIGIYLFNYGWKIQIGSFLQFLNYRLSYYFLEIFKGVSSVGIFSIGIAFSEAIWTISRSMSVVVYADTLNTKDIEKSILKVKSSMKTCLWLTFSFSLILILVPADFYSLVFGSDFKNTKIIILLMTPGILAIALSNIVGHYFSAVHELRILNIKSIIGLFFTVVGCSVLIPRYGIFGACIATSTSYVLSSLYLFLKFYKITDFHLRDFVFSKAEVDSKIKGLFQKIRS